MDVDGAILNGYLRLYCTIVGIKSPPPRCRVCQSELDAKYKKRKAGYLCLNCFRERNKQRQHSPHLHAGSSRIRAQREYPLPQKCQIEGCSKLGIRHHEDYNKPLEILWLCPKHHTGLHQNKLTLSVCSW